MAGCRILDVAPLDEKVEAKLARRGIDACDVEWALLAPGRVVRLGPIDHYGDQRYLCYSRTEEGRYLFVVFRLGSEQRAHVITAREMDREEKRHYRTRTR